MILFRYDNQGENRTFELAYAPHRGINTLDTKIFVFALLVLPNVRRQKHGKGSTNLINKYEPNGDRKGEDATKLHVVAK